MHLVISSGRSPMSVATEVGVPVRALKRRGQLHRDAAAGAGDKPEEPIDAAKFRAPEARLREVERENDFLRKVSAFFAKEQR